VRQDVEVARDLHDLADPVAVAIDECRQRDRDLDEVVPVSAA